MKTVRYLALGAFFVLVIVVGWLMYPSDGVAILAYHRVQDDGELYSVSKADFEEQMRYLAENGYKAVSLAEVAAARTGANRLPEKPVVITFDDGYADNYLTALPIMERYSMKATVFIATGVVGQGAFLNWEQIKAMQSKNTEIGSHTVNHVAMTDVSADDRLKEAVESKTILEEKLGTPIYFFAYPHGDFDIHVIETLKQAGYQGACTGITGLNYGADNLYMLKRVNVPWPKYGLWEFKLRMLRANIYGKLGL